MTVITDISAALTTIGYDVVVRPQEKPDGRQAMILVESIDFDGSEQWSYRMTPKLSITFLAGSGDDVIEKTKKIIKTVEPNVTALTFKFEKPIFAVEGFTYCVRLPCSYTEVIRIE